MSASLAPNSLAAIEEHPLNRIALNWPEPVQPPSNPLDLDFAVTAKVLRNPVRDVTRRAGKLVRGRKSPPRRSASDPEQPR